MRIVVANSEIDWNAVYLDGVKILEGPMLDRRDILEALADIGATVTAYSEIEVDENNLGEIVGEDDELPYFLIDVPVLPSEGA